MANEIETVRNVWSCPSSALSYEKETPPPRVETQPNQIDPL